MSKGRALLSKLAALFTHRRNDREFDGEISEHLALLEKEFERRGFSSEDARYAAKRQFGGVSQLQQTHRESRSIPQLQFLGRDLRFALRTIRKSPWFSVTVVLMLALGIGANSAIFTLADQMLLRLLPVKDPRSLVLLNYVGPFIGGSCRPCTNTFSYPAYSELRDRAQSASTGIAARYQQTVDIAVNGAAQRAQAELVSGNYFEVLGVSPALGRMLTPEQDKVKLAEPYVVLSYAYWQRRFAADPAVLDQSIDVNGHPMTIIGVAPRGFLGFDEVSPSDVFLSMMMKPIATPDWDDMERRNSTWLRMFARLRPGVSIRAAEVALAPPLQSVLRADIASVHRDERFSQTYLKNHIVLASASKGFNNLEDKFGKPIYVLWAMVAFLLLIACVNVANLVLARASTRQKEMAVRLALGAGRGSLIRLVLAESIVLAAIGALAGLLFSSFLSGVLRAFLPIENSGLLIRTTPNAAVFFFTGGLAILTMLLFGLAPALQSTRPDPAPALKNERPSLSLAPGQIGVRRLLVFAQIALSVLLLIGAGLFARSLQNLLTTDIGVEPTNLIGFLVTPSRHRYTAPQARQYFLELQNRLSHLPGVTSASASEIPVLAGQNETNTVLVENHPPRHGEDMNPTFNAVLPGFFRTMGIPLVAGRDFTPRDTFAAPKVVVVNQEFVKRYVPSGNPLGLHLGWFGSAAMEYQIVGVVKNSKQSDLREQIKPYTYISALQYPGAVLPDLTFYVRTVRNPVGATRSIERTVAQLDPSIPASNFRNLNMQIDETQTMDRLFAWLSISFAAAATLLASIGLYGLMAFAVMRRKFEIGIRIALGARRNQVLQLMMKEVWLLAIAGVSFGLLLAAWLVRFVQSQLYGIKAHDPFVMVFAAAGIFLLSGVAAYFPVRRAASGDPTLILRHE